MGSALTSKGSTRAWRKLRRYVIARDKGICWRCGRGGATTADHIIPRAHGGSDAPANLAAAHDKCNRDKGDKVVDQPVTSRRW